MLEYVVAVFTDTLAVNMEFASVMGLLYCVVLGARPDWARWLVEAFECVPRDVRTTIVRIK